MDQRRIEGFSDEGAGRAAPDLVVRPTQDADIAAVAAIYAHHVCHGTASFELEPPSPTEMGERWRGVVGMGCPHLVAVRSERVLGYAYAAPYRSRPAYRHTVENSVYVDQLAHRQGIGGALLERLILECAERGFRQIVAVIGDNAPASIGLHASRGFETVGRLHAVGFKFGRWCDTTLMQRPLGEGAATLPSAS